MIMNSEPQPGDLFISSDGRFIVGSLDRKKITLFFEKGEVLELGHHEFKTMWPSCSPLKHPNVDVVNRNLETLGALHDEQQHFRNHDLLSILEQQLRKEKIAILRKSALWRKNELRIWPPHTYDQDPQLPEVEIRDSDVIQVLNREALLDQILSWLGFTVLIGTIGFGIAAIAKYGGTTWGIVAWILIIEIVAANLISRWTEKSIWLRHDKRGAYIRISQSAKILKESEAQWNWHAKEQHLEYLNSQEKKRKAVKYYLAEIEKVIFAKNGQGMKPDKKNTLLTQAYDKYTWGEDSKKCLVYLNSQSVYTENLKIHKQVIEAVDRVKGVSPDYTTSLPLLSKTAD